MTEQWRPEQLPEERLARWARDTFPGGMEGHSPNPVPSFPTFHDQAASIRGVAPTEGGGISYNQELLKDSGVAPSGTYDLEFKPIPRSLHCTVGGIPQLFDDDFNFDGSTLTVHPGMGLRTGDVLWVRYAYRVGAAIEPSSKLFLPIGSSWKYIQNFGYTIPLAGDISTLGYDDSGWLNGVMAFGTAGYWPDPDVRTDLVTPLELWVRTESESEGGTISWAAHVDNALKVWIDGVLVINESSFLGGFPSGSFSLSAGSHAIACYGSGDGSFGDTLNVTFEES